MQQQKRTWLSLLEIFASMVCLCSADTGHRYWDVSHRAAGLLAPENALPVAPRPAERRVSTDISRGRGGRVWRNGMLLAGY
jgi:hypothetical protein